MCRACWRTLESPWHLCPRIHSCGTWRPHTEGRRPEKTGSPAARCPSFSDRRIPGDGLLPQGEGQRGGAFLLCGERRGRVSGGVPGPAAVGQQVLYRLREALTAEPLEECDGVSAGVLGVAEPGAAVFDAETVHLLCGVIPADLLNMVPQGLQQIRQICLPGGLHLCVCESVDCACFRFSHLLPENEKQPGEMPRRQGASPGCFPLIVSYSSGWGLTSSAFSAPCAGSCSVSGVMLSSCS